MYCIVLYCIVLAGMPRSLSRARFACVQFSPAFEKKNRKQRLLTDKKTRENSMYSFYVTITTRTFSTQLVLLSFSRVSQMKVSKGNQRRGGVRGTEDKFTCSRACVVQVSLSDTQSTLRFTFTYTNYIQNLPITSCTILQNRISIA